MTDYIAYTVTDRDGKKWWTRVGTATRNRDGSFAVKFTVVPMGDVVIRPRNAESEGA